MVPRLLQTLVYIIVAGGLAQIAQAQHRTQDMGAVWRAAEAFAREQTQTYTGEVSIELAPPDQRIKLAACKSLRTDLPAGSRLWGKSHVAVRCEAPETWSIMVPMTVKVVGQALYAARPIARGQALTEGDIETRRSDLTQISGAILTDPRDALDKVSNVALAAGLPLRRDMLKGATVVVAGEEVIITYAGDNLRVSSSGKAMNSGAIGDSIQVRSASGKVIRSTVTGKGAVEVR